MTSKDMAKAPAVVALPGEDQPASLGQLALQPNIRAAVTINNKWIYSIFEPPNFAAKTTETLGVSMC
jgi:hypothetical protein